MLLLLTIALLVLGTTLMANIYSIFNPFMENLGDIKHYNIAYYGALSSIERAESALRYHKAGFEGKSGWTGNNSFGNSSDGKINNFSLLSMGNNGMWWNINSRTSGTIPRPGKGNIEPVLQTGGSENFNKLGYDTSEEFVLDIDMTGIGKAYTGNITWNRFNGEAISGTIKLPKKIKDELRSLRKGGDLDGDGIGNDTIVNRSLFGTDTNGNNFTILPTINVDYENGIVNNESDSSIRESSIGKIGFSSKVPKYNFNPTGDSGGDDLTGHNIIPSSSNFSERSFSHIFQNGTGLHLKFSLVNLMKTQNDEGVYPFLSYKFNFCSDTNCNNTVSELPDRFFHIDGKSKVGKYEVEIKIDKPVIESSASSDFTILF